MSGCKDCGANRISPNSLNFTDIGFWLCDGCLINRVLKYEQLQSDLDAAKAEIKQLRFENMQLEKRIAELEIPVQSMS
jgi:cell division protein FtsB